MSIAPDPINIPDPAQPAPPVRSRGFWSDAWLRYRRRRLSMAALGIVVFLAVVARFAPLIVGTKPIVCRYKGQLYFPALGYLVPAWERNPVFLKDRIRERYSINLKKKDPESWAIWPLVYQDPMRQVMEGEWPNQPENPMHDAGGPSRFNFFGTTKSGIDVFAAMVHGTTTALLVGFLAMGIAATIGIVLGSLAGYFRGWIDMVISRVIEVVMCIPNLVLILALIAILPKTTIWHIMAVIGLTGWTGIARLARGEFLRLREMEFTTAARRSGRTRPGLSFATSCQTPWRRCWCQFRSALPVRS